VKPRLLGKGEVICANTELCSLITYLISYGYNVTRTPVGDKTQFAVECISDNKDNKSQENACILAYYMATGELDPNFVHR
jgi:hypothetical protein